MPTDINISGENAYENPAKGHFSKIYPFQTWLDTKGANKTDVETSLDNPLVMVAPGNGYCYYNAVFAGIILNCVGDKGKLKKFYEDLALFFAGKVKEFDLELSDEALKRIVSSYADGLNQLVDFKTIIDNGKPDFTQEEAEALIDKTVVKLAKFFVNPLIKEQAKEKISNFSNFLTHYIGFSEDDEKNIIHSMIQAQKALFEASVTEDKLLNLGISQDQAFVIMDMIKKHIEEGQTTKEGMIANGCDENTAIALVAISQAAQVTKTKLLNLNIRQDLAPVIMDLIQIQINHVKEGVFNFECTDLETFKSKLSEIGITELPESFSEFYLENFKTIQQDVKIDQGFEPNTIDGETTFEHNQKIFSNWGYCAEIINDKTTTAQFNRTKENIKQSKKIPIIIRNETGHYNLLISNKFSKECEEAINAEVTITDPYKEPFTTVGIEKITIESTKLDKIKNTFQQTVNSEIFAVERASTGIGGVGVEESKREAENRDAALGHLAFFHPKIEVDENLSDDERLKVATFISKNNQKFDFSSTNDALNPDTKTEEDLKNNAKKLINEALQAALNKVKETFPDFNEGKAAVCIMLAIKNGGVSNNKKAFLEDLKKFGGDEISNADLEPYFLFSKTFQKETEKQQIFTGNQNAKKMVGMRLKRLTPDYAYQMLEKGLENESATAERQNQVKEAFKQGLENAGCNLDALLTEKPSPELESPINVSRVDSSNSVGSGRGDSSPSSAGSRSSSPISNRSSSPTPGS